MFLSDCAQEVRGELYEQTTAVTCFAVRRDGTTVCQSAERSDGRIDDLMAWQVVKICDQSKAAAVAVEGRIIEAVCKSLGHAIL